MAAEHVSFTHFSKAEVDVRGWPALEAEDQKAAWIETYSDHGLLYFQLDAV